MLSPREVFEQAGYWVADRLFSQLQVDRIAEHFDAVLRGEYDTGRVPHAVDRFGDALIKVSNAWAADSVLRSVVMDPRIARIAADLLGADELYLWADSLYWKAPLRPTEQGIVGWHQDKMYWAPSSTDAMITACVNLYRADALSGGMRFAEGSNRWGLIFGPDALSGADNAGEHGRPAIPNGERWREVCPTLEPGQVTFHHCFTFHGSGPNFSAEPRRSITIHMVSGDGRCRRPFDDASLASVQIGDPFRPPLFPRLYPPERIS